MHKDFHWSDSQNRAVSWSLERGYSNDSINAFPYRVISNEKNSLRFIAQIKDFDMDFICRGPNQGFQIYWNVPGEVPNSMSKSIFIPDQQDVVILMKPTMVTIARRLLDYSPEIRQCYAESERSLNFLKLYTKSNCDFECFINFTLSVCGCVKFSMPHDSKTKICKATSLPCLLDVEKHWLSRNYTGTEDVYDCKCLPSCTEIKYEAQLRQTDYDYEKTFKSLDYDLNDNHG